MATHSGFTSATSLSDAVKSIRPQLLTRLKDGFQFLSECNEQTLDYLVNACKESVTTSLQVSEVEVSQKLSITEDQALTALSSGTFLIFMLGPSKYTQVQLLSEAIELKLISPPYSDRFNIVIGKFAAHQGEVTRELNEMSLATTVLPSLQTFEITVDMRIKFEQEKIVNAVPVAITHIDTDAENQVVWFQMTSIQIERLMVDLQKSLIQMRTLEKKIENLLD